MAVVSPPFSPRGWSRSLYAGGPSYRRIALGLGPLAACLLAAVIAPDLGTVTAALSWMLRLYACAACAAILAFALRPVGELLAGLPSPRSWGRL
jgi:hypothetical protein